MIKIYTKLNEGIYASQGGGETREFSSLKTSGRNLLLAYDKLLQRRSDLKEAYGNIGCGESWMEIDGKKLDDYDEINLRSIKTKENPFGEGRTPTQQCEEFIQHFAPKKKDKLNEKMEQMLADYVEKTTDVESLAQFTKDITDNCMTFDENTSTFGVNGIPVKMENLVVLQGNGWGTDKEFNKQDPYILAVPNEDVPLKSLKEPEAMELLKKGLLENKAKIVAECIVNKAVMDKVPKKIQGKMKKCAAQFNQAR